MAYNKQVNPYGVSSSELGWKGFADGGKHSNPGAVQVKDAWWEGDAFKEGIAAVGGKLFDHLSTPEETGKFVGGDLIDAKEAELAKDRSFFSDSENINTSYLPEQIAMQTQAAYDKKDSATLSSRLDYINSDVNKDAIRAKGESYFQRQIGINIPNSRAEFMAANRKKNPKFGNSIVEATLESGKLNKGYTWGSDTSSDKPWYQMWNSPDTKYNAKPQRAWYDFNQD